METRRLILVFVRYPDPGRVKTRLAAAVGETNAADLYRAFVEDLVGRCRSLSCPMAVMVAEAADVERTRVWLTETLGRKPVCLSQQGCDLGERMAAALEGAFGQGFDQAILVGSDIPDLPIEILKKGFDALGSNDAVIGPCRDGGYYLIGFRSIGFRREVFRGVHWSTDTVFSETCRLMEENHLDFGILPPWDDVDTFEDLKRLYLRVKTVSYTHLTLPTIYSV